MVQFNEEKQEKKIANLRAKEEEELVKILSQKYGVDYIDLSTFSIKTDALKILEEKKARDNNVAIFDITGKKISMAVLSPTSDKVSEITKELEEAGYQLTIYMTSTKSLEKAWDRYKEISFAVKVEGGIIDISREDVEKLLGELRSLKQVKESLEEVTNSQKIYKTSRLLELILSGALATESSDIHIEPQEEKVLVRYRLDGILLDIIFLSPKDYELIASRIKLVSGLKLNVKNRSQDGRFSIDIGETNVEIRTSVLPGAYGESIVLRILNPKSISVPLEELGIEPHLLSLLEKEIRKPNGMILNTGPTGSGKTTTLYAFLRKRYSSNIKIITIEDPIEYHIEGVTQTQVNIEKQYTFASGLKSSLRQDPDVIMVGEIRDSETAEIAINASLTGHLVFSTLHTNNAAGAFTRLIDLGVNPKVLTSAISIAMAQRLLRKLCPYCKKEVEIKDRNKILIEKIFSKITRKDDYKVNTEKMWEAVGCEKCNNTGYKGRIGIFEAILTDEKIEEVVTINPSEREIKKAAEGQGILTLEQDGIIKVLNGTTSLDEVERVVNLEETE